MSDQFFMPMSNNPDAPRFSSRYPGFDIFFEEVDELGTRAGLSVNEKVKFAIRYAGQSGTVWRYLPSVTSPPAKLTFDAFKAEVLELYPLLSDHRYTIRDLEQLVERTRNLPDLSLQGLSSYHEHFLLYSMYLMSKDRLYPRERNHLYLLGFPEHLQRFIRQLLFIRQPDIHPYESYDLKDITKAALFVLDMSPSDLTILSSLTPKIHSRTGRSANNSSYGRYSGPQSNFIASRDPLLSPASHLLSCLRASPAPGIAAEDSPQWDVSSDPESFAQSRSSRQPLTSIRNTVSSRSSKLPDECTIAAEVSPATETDH